MEEYSYLVTKDQQTAIIIVKEETQEKAFKKMSNFIKDPKVITTLPKLKKSVYTMMRNEVRWRRPRVVGNNPVVVVLEESSHEEKDEVGPAKGADKK